MRELWKVGWILLLGMAGTGALAADEDLRAVITQAGGGAEVHAKVGDVHPARPMMILLPNARVLAPEVANPKVTLVCSDNRAVRLDGEIDWRLTKEGCEAGENLPVGTWTSLAQAGGTLFTVEEGLLRRRKSRGPDIMQGQAALLSPRGRIAGTDRPDLVWTAVEGVEVYEVVVEGVPSFTLHIPANEAGCGPVDGWLPDEPTRICSIPYPENQPPLYPGFSVWIRTAVRYPGEVDFRSAYDDVLVELTADAHERQARWQEIDALPFDPATRLRLRAANAAEDGLHDPAVHAYRQSLETEEDPSTRILYGDALMALGLRTYGEAQYRKAAAGGDATVEAAARKRLDRLAAQAEADAETGR